MVGATILIRCWSDSLEMKIDCEPTMVMSHLTVIKFLQIQFLAGTKSSMADMKVHKFMLNIEKELT